MIRGIIFDCFGVLYHGSLDQLFELTPPDKYQEMRDLHHSYDYGYIDKSDFFQGAGVVIGKSSAEVAAICSKEHIRNDRLVEYIKTLRPHYKTALLSNVGRGFLDDLFTKNELATLFDVEILSAEVNIMKPSAAIYELTAEKLGLRAEECFMIDDVQVNIDAAKQVGMSGLTYTTTSLLQAEIAKFSEVKHA